ncbi:hypothetical protein [Oceanicella sp. SM1341]|uniref:hypothetical protein n=1 Tax=Oceanicella sp. SM1341 TaxID=1548889 RepID=UPI000E472BB7|nr:hypothetical protein [Oceanicella sp. SM1341]
MFGNISRSGVKILLVAAFVTFPLISVSPAFAAGDGVRTYSAEARAELRVALKAAIEERIAKAQGRISAWQDAYAHTNRTVYQEKLSRKIARATIWLENLQRQLQYVDVLREDRLVQKYERITGRKVSAT